MASTQDETTILILLSYYSHSIHTIWILYICIRSRYKTMPSPAIQIQNGVDPDQYIYPDPLLPNTIYLLTIIRLLVHTSGLYSLPLANNTHINMRGHIHTLIPTHIYIHVYSYIKQYIQTH